MDPICLIITPLAPIMYSNNAIFEVIMNELFFAKLNT